MRQLFAGLLRKPFRVKGRSHEVRRCVAWFYSLLRGVCPLELPAHDDSPDVRGPRRCVGPAARGTVVATILLCGTTVLSAAEDSFTRTSDVIYGRKHGMALTMDVFTPKEKADGVP